LDENLLNLNPLSRRLAKYKTSAGAEFFADNGKAVENSRKLIRAS